MHSAAVGSYVTKTQILDTDGCFYLLKTLSLICIFSKDVFFFFVAFVGFNFPSFFSAGCCGRLAMIGEFVSTPTAAEVGGTFGSHEHLPHPPNSSPLHHYSIVYLANGLFHPVLPVWAITITVTLNGLFFKYGNSFGGAHNIWGECTSRRSSTSDLTV